MSPDLDFLPESVWTERGFIKVNEHYRTSDPKIFAIGDTVKLGLLTDSIGQGRKAAETKSSSPNWKAVQIIARLENYLK